MKGILLPLALGVCIPALGLARATAAPTDAAPATLRITLPADAILTIDGQSTKSTSANRRFITPPLEPGRTYHYDLKAVFVRDDVTVTLRKTVTVVAGRQTTVSLVVPGSDSPAPTQRSFYYDPASPGNSSEGAAPAQSVSGFVAPPRIYYFYAPYYSGSSNQTTQGSDAPSGPYKASDGGG